MGVLFVCFSGFVFLKLCLLWEQLGHCQILNADIQGKNLEEDEFSYVCDLSGKYHAGNWGKYAVSGFLFVLFVYICLCFETEFSTKACKELRSLIFFLPFLW